MGCPCVASVHPSSFHCSVLRIVVFFVFRIDNTPKPECESCMCYIPTEPIRRQASHAIKIRSTCADFQPGFVFCVSRRYTTCTPKREAPQVDTVLLDRLRERLCELKYLETAAAGLSFDHLQVNGPFTSGVGRQDFFILTRGT